MERSCAPRTASRRTLDRVEQPSSATATCADRRRGRRSRGYVIAVGRIRRSIRSRPRQAESRCLRPGPDLLLRWWRGLDLNQRPSGYERDGQGANSYHPVPKTTAELGFIAPGLPVRPYWNEPVGGCIRKTDVKTPAPRQR